MYQMRDVEVNKALREKYKVNSYVQLEQKLIESIYSVQMMGNSHAECEVMIDLASLSVHNNKRLQALEWLEQADALIIEHAYQEFLSAVYLLRAHLALLHNDWTMSHELCKLGITAASKLKRYDHIACFYLIWLQLALNDALYERAILFGKLVLHFARKHKGDMQNFRLIVAVFLLFAYVALQKKEEANQLLSKIVKKNNSSEASQLYVKMAKCYYAWMNTKGVEDEKQLHDISRQLWKLSQFSEVKTIFSVMLKQTPSLCATYTEALAYTNALQLDEEMIRLLERLDYHDQIRTVQMMNGNDEKIGCHTGKSYRKLLNERVAAATEEQFITIATFVIHVNNPDLLDKYLKIKYDYFIKIEQDLAKFCLQGIKGKYYPSSFCLMFITEEPLDIQEVAKKCKDYLDTIQLELEGEKIDYRIHIGASSVQKKMLASLQSLYQEADQSLYYAKVTERTLIIYEKEG